MSYTIGVIGGGQLGRMLALAGIPLGFRFVFLDPSPEACARHVGEHICAAYDDEQALQALASRCDIVTFEFENTPPQAIAQLGALLPAYPPARALQTARDRLHEKTLFQRLDIPTPRFANIESQADLERAVEDIGLPAVLKTRSLGYDGKGQKLLRSRVDVAGAFTALGEVPCLLEAFVRFSGEVSLLAVRGRDGACSFYSLVSNVHRNGILHSSQPAPAHPRQALAQEYGGRVLAALDYVGVLAFEFFEYGDQLVANEIAPRVHNSGHWSIEGAQCSQFENHLRAIAGLPLGSTALREHAAMLNLIGAIPTAASVLEIPGAHLHAYDKRSVPGRKVGHLTFCLPDAAALEQSMARGQALLAED